MSPASKAPPLLSWDPFAGWETSQAELDSDVDERGGSESLESTLPSTVETADEEDAVIAPEWFSRLR